MSIRKPFICFLLLSALAGSASADGGDSAARPVADPDYRAAVSAIEAADYPRAIGLLEGYTARHPDDANGWNWLGYASRKGGKLTAAFGHYEKALKINPEHRGAREYLGEAYLMAGNLAAAEGQLKQLDRLCWLPCEEQRDLKKAIAAYKTKPR